MTELATFKAEMAEASRRQLERAVRRRVTELELKKDVLQGVPEQTGFARLLWGRRFQDGASPVFASDNCFNESVAGQYDNRVDWPSLAEMKEESERRGGKHGRCLPWPHLNAVDPRALAAGEADVFHTDGTIRWQAKVVRPNRAFIMPVSPPEMQVAGPDSYV